MKAIRPFAYSLVMALLLLVLVSAVRAYGGDASPGRRPMHPVSEVSTEPGMLVPMYTGCGGKYGVPSSDEAYEQEVLRLVNEARAGVGLPPLKRVSLLDDAARYHAADMGQDGYFDHDSFDRDGDDFVYACSWSDRVESYYADSAVVGENIAAGLTTPEDVMDVWMDSPLHRANILSPGFWEIGVGYREGSGTNHYYYWVQDFGRRNGVYPVVIDQDAPETYTTTVSLYIYGIGVWTEMRLRNDNGAWTSWQPFQSSLDWTLTRRGGDRTVWVEMKKVTTATTVSSDTIHLTYPTLGNLPGAIKFIYSIPEQRLLFADYQSIPLNVGSDSALTWTIATSGTWFTAAPAGGTTPAALWITPTVFVTSTVYTYTGVVTATVTGPAETGDSPHRIDLTLLVLDEPFSHFYLPVIMRNYTPPSPPPLYPDDPFYDTHQWGLKKVNAPDAWGRTTGQGILIAVLDSGADLDHPDLAGKLRTDIDWDFVNGDDVADDDHGHGTHVSGIAAAATDNGVGVAGMGWDVQILPLKVLDHNGDGYGNVIASAIISATDRGADVINLSLGTEIATTCPSYMQVAVTYAYTKGVVVVAAAGNEGTYMEIFPADCEHVLGVAATDSSDNRASYSNYGYHVSVAAPGSSIYSTGWTGDGETDCSSSYCYKSGTSMATPHVAGLAALVLARYPSYTPDRVASAILDNAVDRGTTGWDQYYGCGRIDAAQALSQGAQDFYPVCLQGVTTWSLDAQEATTAAPFAPGEIIVSFRPGVQAEKATRQYGASVELLPALGAWRLRVPVGQEQAVLAELRADPAVIYAELNYVVSAQ